ncbi:hypothetical protein JTB14_003428 [Gonioctena quinquepunctata]|nr:hypothetical protein JTB14_003428 [Gonioctena quinquepunctata]
MKKLMEMDNKYTDLLNKYEEQVKVNEVLKSEILIIKSQLGKEQNKNGQNENRKREKPQWTLPIKVCFTSEKEKEEFLGARKKKMITSKDLGYEEGNVIYLNHDLTKANQYLFKEVLRYKKENNYRFAWINHGKIYIRKDEHSPVRQIEDTSDLKN